MTVIEKQTKKSEDLWYFDVDQPWHKPGRIIQLVFRSPKNPKEEAYLPALILNTRIHNLRPPSHDVGFVTSWLSGEISGLLVITDIMPSRYMLKEDIPDSIWKIFKDFESEEYGLDQRDLFYTKTISENEREIIYPFKDDKFSIPQDEI